MCNEGDIAEYDRIFLGAFMVTTRQQALEITAKTRAQLEEIYGKRLRGVYLYGSAARNQLHPDSEIDIAVILDQIIDRFGEHERISQFASDVSFLFVSEADYQKGRFAVHRTIKEEGILA